MGNLKKKTTIALFVTAAACAATGLLLARPAEKYFSRAAEVEEVDLYQPDNMIWSLSKVVSVDEDDEGNATEWTFEPIKDDETLLHDYVYVYNYRLNGDTRTYYSATELSYAPYAEWTNWEQVEKRAATSSVVSWNGREQYVAIAVPTVWIRPEGEDPRSVSKYTVEYDNNSATDPCPDAQQVYTATAHLTATDGFTFVLNEENKDESFDELGITITLENGGKEARVTKKWYIVNEVNRIFAEANGSSETNRYSDYSVPSWTFGNIERVPTPYLAYGDDRFFPNVEQLGGHDVNHEYVVTNEQTGRDEWKSDTIIRYGDGVYSAEDGWLCQANPMNADADDFLTFTLTREGETDAICRDANRSQWNYYFNRYMPVGKYSVTLNVKDLSISGQHTQWWDGSNVTSVAVYRGFTRTYTFEVTPSEFEVDLSGIRTSPVDLANLKKDGFEATVNHIFSLAGVHTTGSGVITETALNTYGGYWATRAETDYQFTPTLAFNLSEFMSDEYYALDAEIWDDYISTARPQTYRLYYKALMANYIWNVKLPEDKYKNALILEVYQELAAPVLVNEGKVGYTGKALSPEFTDGSVDYLSKFAVSVNKGVILNVEDEDYEITCTLHDPVHYKWVGKELGEAANKVYLTVETAKITVPVLAHKSWTGEPQQPDELNNIPTGADGQPIYEIVEGIPQNWINATKEGYPITLQLKDTVNYEWEDVNGQPTGTPGQIQIRFFIDPAVDSWKDSFRISSWEFGDFLAEMHFLGATSMRSQDVYYSVATDAEGNNLCENLEEFKSGYTFPTNELVALNAGTYYIRVYTKGSENASALTSEWIPFEVKTAKNEWLVAPGITEWTWGDYAGQQPTVGSAKHGTPSVKYYKLDRLGNRLDEGKDALDEYREQGTIGIGGLPAGKYEMVVSVAATANYTGIADTVVSFTIAKGNNTWTTTPSVQNWIFGSEPVVKGAARYGDDEVAFTVLTLDGETVYEGKLSELSQDKSLYRLKPGKYTYIAQVLEADNWTGISATGEFSISSTDANRWIVAPHIESWTVGETPSEPVFEAAENDSAKQYWFLDKDGNNLGARAPETAGEYVLVVYVPGTDDGKDFLETRVNFTVYERPILTNTWKVTPNIQGWKEGDTPSTPVGTAANGEVTFTYKTAAGEALTAKPTTAGNYILTVTATAPYYADLVAEVLFTVLPAPVSVNHTAQDANGNPVYLTVDGLAAGSALGLTELANAGDNAGFYKRTQSTLRGMGYALGTIYDITLTDANGTAIQPEGTVTVTVSVPTWLQGKSGLQIAYINDRGEVELMGGLVSGETITFTTSHFSTYCFVWSDGSVSASQTGWSIFLAVIIEFCIVAAIGSSAVVLVLLFKRKKAEAKKGANAPSKPEAKPNQKPTVVPMNNLMQEAAVSQDQQEHKSE